MPGRPPPTAPGRAARRSQINTYIGGPACRRYIVGQAAPAGSLHQISVHVGDAAYRRTHIHTYAHAGINTVQGPVLVFAWADHNNFFVLTCLLHQISRCLSTHLFFRLFAPERWLPIRPQFRDRGTPNRIKANKVCIQKRDILEARTRCAELNCKQKGYLSAFGAHTGSSGGECGFIDDDEVGDEDSDEVGIAERPSQLF